MNITTATAWFSSSWILKVASCIEYTNYMQTMAGRSYLADWPKPQEFEARVRAVARLIEDVMPRLAEPGKITLAEYGSLLLAPLYAELPFLDAEARELIAFDLVFAYGSQPWVSSEEERAMAQKFGCHTLEQMRNKDREMSRDRREKEQQAKALDFAKLLERYLPPPELQKLQMFMSDDCGQRYLSNALNGRHPKGTGFDFPVAL